MMKTSRGGARGTVGLTVLAFTASLLGIVALAWSGGMGDDFLGEASAEVAPKPAAPDDAAGSAELGPGRVEGHNLCVDCHRSEVTAWRASKHATQAFQLLLAKNADEYATKMGIPPARILRSSICLKCHATPQVDFRGHEKAIVGVSCEACHSPAGGEQGWLNAHAVYGPPGTRRVDEDATHYEARMQRCREAGQLRSEDLYLLTRRCYECHIVGEEKLVNEAGHKVSGDKFEMLEWSLGDVRHNFHLDQRTNAVVSTLWTDDLRHPGRSVDGRQRMMYVVGQLVAAETVLRHLSEAEDWDDDYFEELIELLWTAQENLEDTDDDTLVEISEDLLDLLEQYEDEDLDPDDPQPWVDAAEAISQVAKKFSAGDGSELENVEIPEIDEDVLEKAFRP